VRTFKIGFKLDFCGRLHTPLRGEETDAEKKRACFCWIYGDTLKIDTDFVRELQAELSIIQRPFRRAAVRLGMSEQDVVKQLELYRKSGVVRRTAAILRPVQAGFGANVLVAWAPTRHMIGKLGRYASGLGAVSHCYERTPYVHWPYSVYTMIHGRSYEECSEVIRKIDTKLGPIPYLELTTLREFKKVRVSYYEPAYDQMRSRTKRLLSVSESCFVA